MPGSEKTKAWSEGSFESKTLGVSEMPQISKIAKKSENDPRKATLTQVIRKDDGKRANGGMKGRKRGGIGPDKGRA